MSADGIEVPFRDLRSSAGFVVSAEEQRRDPAGAFAKLDPRSATSPRRDPGSIVRYADGAVGMYEPSSTAMEATVRPELVEPSLPQTSKEEQTVLKRILNDPRRVYVPHKIFNDDDRTRVTPTNYFSPNAIGQLTTDNGTSICTAAVYAARSAITAAHCIFDSTTGHFRGLPWTFYRGQDGSTANYPPCNVAGATLPGSYSGDGDVEHDFAALALDCTVLGSPGNGYFPLVAVPSSGIQTYKDGLRIAGYPAEAQNQNVVGQQWKDEGRAIWDNSVLKTINVDVTGGESGAPWNIPCTNYGWDRCEIGPHSGAVYSPGFGMNTGHQLTPSDIQMLINYEPLPAAPTNFHVLEGPLGCGPNQYGSQSCFYPFAWNVVPYGVARYEVFRSDTYCVVNRRLEVVLHPGDHQVDAVHAYGQPTECPEPQGINSEYYWVDSVDYFGRRTSSDALAYEVCSQSC